jgi:hypothetical protein
MFSRAIHRCRDATLDLGSKLSAALVRTIARPSAMRCRWPPDRACGLRSSRPSRVARLWPSTVLSLALPPRSWASVAGTLVLGADPFWFVVLSGLVFFTCGEIYSLFPSTATDTFGSKFATTNAGLLYTPRLRERVHGASQPRTIAGFDHARPHLRRRARSRAERLDAAPLLWLGLRSHWPREHQMFIAFAIELSRNGARARRTQV